MVEIILPDGSSRSYDQETLTCGQIAASIGKGLAKAAIAGVVNGQKVDLDAPVPHGAQVAIITEDSPEGLEIIRHSASHLMAQAVKTLFPQAQVTIGPAIENGFYYDFDYERPFTPDDLTAIENCMRKLAKRNEKVERRVMPRDEAVAYFQAMGELYKAEIIGAIPAGEDVSLYSQGEFTDLCRGPHVPSTGKLKAFKVMKAGGAYWRGDSRNKMLQRIYGTAWATEADLKAYLTQMEEAEKRDHRRIGKDLDLFSVQEDAGGGLVFWHPRGSRIRRVIEDFWKDRHVEAGYEFLYTPHIANRQLWNTSGHTDFYSDSMFSPMEVDEQAYQIRPMNCPFHILIYKDRRHSYRELPFRWGELGTVYRYEMSGALHGLFRVRGFTQDDAHIFCTEQQIEEEIQRILDLTLDILRTYGFSDFEINLSTRPEKSVGSAAIWDKATEALRRAIVSRDLSYVVDEGGGAFYGPKIDVKITDSIGRKWQCSTVQLDFNLPERFDMGYIGEDGESHRPIMIHRALMGSLERFFGILVEHYAGWFPMWLAPVQAVVCSITDAQHAYAETVLAALKKAGLRVEIDLRNEKVGYKIREHTLKRVPYLLVVGDKEREEGTVNVRLRSGKSLGSLPIQDVVERLVEEAASRALSASEDQEEA
ncbi:Ser-tRNA(Thr) hydrolase / threonyl-tRNA synthetase [Magnetococcus marinus MC-1]|uniref:Threonine--tRNA ligase n=1 Tax=Magnetococcus marinus (strain ATCC BAA-1437 / JCM 17883 / MC-1) TaxID=156889 RepID=SYT_MAGMM|nr:threonine--tRNA ligase [Magnetococcus marinus]A0L4J6.1 RecName: Full=Threonine--tRNA ligase; AltName: Full=Threonyl-tRNA synthetase; Short=ThrRS [Magnetococcus marinus MC-1]ABK42889.1 Ser-tRNA(Thr) hydrolase / threonyl-tRNA synthetase [Magnetococcus marinus MC-1]